LYDEFEPEFEGKFLVMHASLWRQSRVLLIAPAVLTSLSLSSSYGYDRRSDCTRPASCEPQAVLKASIREGDYKIKIKAKTAPALAAEPDSGSKQAKDFGNFLIVTGSANVALSKDICSLLGTSATPTDVWQFSDGELSCSINETVRGKDIYLIQSFGTPVNDNIMELLLTISALRRSGANNITAVIPYFGYKFHRNRGLPITTPYGSRFMWNTAADIAKMLRVCGVDKIISVDLQRAGQNHEACFFENVVPVETVDSTSLFVDFFANTIYHPDNENHKHVQNKVVVLSSNTEFVKKAKRFQRKLQAKAKVGKVGFAAFLDDDVNVAMNHPNAASGDVDRVLGDVDGCDVIIIDDIVESGAGMVNLTRRLTRAGAKRVYVAATHGLYMDNAMHLIDLSAIDLVVTTDSLPLPKDKGKISHKIQRLSVAALLANVIETEYNMYYTNIGGAGSNGRSGGSAAEGDDLLDDDDDDDDERLPVTVADAREK